MSASDRASAGRRARRVVLAGLLLLAPVLLGAQASGAAPRPRAAGQPAFRAVLVRGAEAVKGLPGFGTNALPGLYGEYRIDLPAPRPGSLRVWMSAEWLYLAPADWAAARVGGRDAYEFRGAAPFTGAGDPGGEGRLVLFDRPFAAAGQGADPRAWYVLTWIPSGADRTEIDLFIDLFLDRLAYFLGVARSPSDASFPAVLEK